MRGSYSVERGPFAGFFKFFELFRSFKGVFLELLRFVFWFFGRCPWFSLGVIHVLFLASFTFPHFLSMFVFCFGPCFGDFAWEFG